ncbi:serine hydrolase domain-containing protein [Paenibacillus sp. 481]|uniref:serine hydrolase domain-containing protein n=1 Tax=Paenibacillus sp. 481 TaxID=2835869 RepID=UPI001E34E744|nr:serine hydrolase [Paenibacillus sp. 481]UHA75011.1 serine hydrolase [Paenibacillus sp. 481]
MINAQIPQNVSSTIYVNEWKPSCPTEVNIDTNQLQAAVALLDPLFPRLRCFLLARNERLITEIYRNDGAPEALNDLRSATKSFIAALLGIAMHQHRMHDVEIPVLPLLESIHHKRSAADPLWQQLTIRHFLSMSSGLMWHTGKRLGEQWIQRFHQSSSWRGFSFRLPVRAHSIGQFQYRSIDSHLLSVLLTRITGMRADTFAEQHLFGPLGITNYRWQLSPDDDAAGHIGLELTGRDMLKFGQLFLNQGQWHHEHNKSDSNGNINCSSNVDCNSIGNVNNNNSSLTSTSIIPANWVRESLKQQIEGLPAYGHYGYQWWIQRLRCARKKTYTHAAYALGHGGQIIYVIPKYGLTLVFASNPHVNRYRHPRQWIEEHLLPACH